MKAIVKKAPGEGHVEYMDVPEPTPGANEVKIKVAYAGLCGTDFSIIKGTFPSNPPVILGHEYSGVIESVGAGVTDFKKGDRVISETAQVICGRCERCLSGRYLMCTKRLSIGYGVNGGMAEYIIVRQEILHRVPDNVALDEAAVSEPAACACHAVLDHVHVKPTHNVLVIGPGTIGQLVAQLAIVTGANVIVCGTESDKKRLELIQSMGATTIASNDKDDMLKRIMELTDNKGIDIFFDCSGATDAINCGLNSLKPRGALVAVGLSKPNIDFDYNLIPMKELQVFGSYAHINMSWANALALMGKGRFNIKPLIELKFPFSKWEEALDSALSGKGIKVLLYPDGSTL